MLVNYFKIAIKVLWKNKFYTFVSLFGISFTLMTLLLLTAFIHEEFGNQPPMSKKDRMVFLSHGIHRSFNIDTTYTIDSTLVSGKMTYDTLSIDTARGEQRSYSSSALKYGVLEDYFNNIEGVEAASFYLPDASYELFTSAGKLPVNVSHTDANYWKIYDFPLLEGRTYTASEVDKAQQLVVVSKSFATKLFGQYTGIVGKTFELNRKTWEIIGVLDIESRKHADAYMSFRVLPPHAFKGTKYTGPFKAVLLADSQTSTVEVEERIAQITANMPQEIDGYTDFKTVALDYKHHYGLELMFDDDPKRPYRILSIMVSILILLFTLLPILNLVNLNTSRILERASEIGIRKSFGASTGQILGQFLFENVLITFIGGLIAIVLSYFLFDMINDSKILSSVILKINWTVFLIGLLISLLFGVVSGFIPAWRTSKISIAQALKQ